uniref:Uncharacterized protein n=1 Tax=Anguilla anguilla TaxID=7936 RepID=A0A0E9S9V3_ANGAN
MGHHFFRSVDWDLVSQPSFIFSFLFLSLPCSVSLPHARSVAYCNH